MVVNHIWFQLSINVRTVKSHFGVDMESCGTTCYVRLPIKQHQNHVRPISDTSASGLMDATSYAYGLGCDELTSNHITVL